MEQRNFSYSDIEPSIVNKEKEFMGWMWGRNDGKLKIFELSNDSARISDEYMKKAILMYKYPRLILKPIPILIKQI